MSVCALADAVSVMSSSFLHLSAQRKAALCASVLRGESSLSETKAGAGRHWDEPQQQIHTAWASQTSPPPAQPFVNRHFDDDSLCRVVPNQYTQSGRLHRHR